jgi:DNA-binding response OmpR family regulator
MSMDEEQLDADEKHVCIVDDDPDILTMYRLRFEQDGYDVLVAT